ncbi:MFS transporter [Bradyrhizobium sp. WBOS7]|uniref:MFS transporter n=1 Tax=Bradyrhizobium betae TaxID=244734 RepID=A0AAE9STH1_9BRAD|nr:MULTISPECIES: MFS transporter [Bradyrhizobium]MDD1569116.1 MFS transporter [Bradyrhizobium sp. WBOS1]UUO37927.1 MFS transporter [Bradyrhizobium sp. WBOS01]MDD1527109.1 MFS transporter [Bradyrhizobium sp. WBOS2]MDD1576235.1 MFS transporter [Bradyrhizobium sp. WBOS7]MDD1602489.1 MFS transporter [Bradyrhizobium sp. WBOS16]
MTAAAPAPSLRDGHRHVVSVAVGSGVVAAIQVGKTAIAAPMLQKDLGLDLAAAGWLTGILAVLGLLGGIPAGSLVARAGDRQSLILGLGLLILGAVIGALAAGYAVLLASRVLEGAGFLLIIVAGPAILNRIAPVGQQDVPFALWSCFMPAGIALAMLVGTFFSDWRALWWGSAGLAALAMAAAWTSIPAAPKRISASWRRTMSDAMRVAASKGPLLLAGCFALYSLMFFALFSFIPVLLMERMNISHSTAGMLSALATASNIMGNVSAGYLLARGARRSVLLVAAYLAMGFSAPGIFLQIFGDTPTLLLCIMFSAVGGLIPAVLISSIPLLAPSAALIPVVTGLVMQGSNLGQVAGPVAVGSAVEAYGWTAALAIMLIAALLAAIVTASARFGDSTPR